MNLNKLKVYFHKRSWLVIKSHCLKSHCLLYFKRYIHKRFIKKNKNADNEQSDLFKRFGNLNKGQKSSEKISFLKNVKILLKEKEYVLNSFKSNLFPITSDITLYNTLRNIDKWRLFYQRNHKCWKSYKQWNI